MAQKYSSPTMRMTAPTTAPPVLSLTTGLIQGYDVNVEAGMFPMDDASPMQEIDHTYTFDPSYADLEPAQMHRGDEHHWDQLGFQQEVVHAGAHLTEVEVGSAYKALAGQLADPPVEIPHKMATSHTSIRMSFDSMQQSLPDVRLPAPMPQTIENAANTPMIAVSQWPHHGFTQEQAYNTDTNCGFLGSQYDDDLATNTLSTSFHSMGSFEQHWSASQDSYYLSPLDEDLLSSNTALSSFDVSTHYLSGQPSLQSASVPFLHMQSRNGLDQEGSIDQAISAQQQYRHTTTPSRGTNVSNWAQGAYNVLDRTNPGGLAPEPAAPPGLRRRKASHSRAGSAGSTAMPCDHCGKIFASRSSRDHHARWHGPKAHICAICDKGFVATKDLRRHEKTHRPAEHEFFCEHLECAYSTKGFARKDHFLRHRKTHGSVVSSPDAIPGYPATF